MGYIRANGAIGISLRENGRLIAHSVKALLVSAPVPEKEEDRGCDSGGPRAARGPCPGFLFLACCTAHGGRALPEPCRMTACGARGLPG
jgi:hypothetical protein